MEKRTSDEWLKETPGLLVIDPDGWDRDNFHNSWCEPITKEEFEKRLSNSTVSGNKLK